MSQLLLAGALTLTSAAAYVVATRLMGLRPGSLPLALRKTVECAGAAVLFAVGNVVAMVLLVLLARVVTGGFVSLYYAQDPIILPLAALQGLAVWWWTELSR